MDVGWYIKLMYLLLLMFISVNDGNGKELRWLHDITDQHRQAIKAMHGLLSLVGTGTLCFLNYATFCSWIPMIDAHYTLEFNLLFSMKNVYIALENYT